MKTPGQVAHATFCESVKAFQPFGVHAAEWSELTDAVRAAWEAAAQAVMNPPRVEAEARRRAAIREASERSVILSRLTPDHLTALRAWEAWAGESWKRLLKTAWENGTVSNYMSADETEALLQVRNIIGPSGLEWLTL